MEVLYYFFALLVLIFLIFYITTFFTGGGFACTPIKVIEEMLDLAKLKKDDFLIDLGCGDGRILIKAAQKEVKSLGIELNPFFYFWSKLNIKSKGLENLSFVKWGNFWSVDLSKANIICIFLPLGFKKLSEKLSKELKQGSKVITFMSPIPDWKPITYTKSGIFLYEKN